MRNLITKERYHSICRMCDSILLKEKNNSYITANNFLHVIREHPNFLINYERLFSRISFLYIYYKIIFNFIKFLKNLFLGSFFNENKIFRGFYNQSKEVDVLIISHLLNKSQINNDNDFYFGEIPKQLNSITLLINHSKNYLNSVLMKSNSGEKIIISNFIGLINEIKIFLSMLKESILLIKQIKQTENSLYKNILKLSSIDSLSPRSLYAIRLGIQVQESVKIFQPKYIMITYEGYAWERVAFSAARKINPKIICIGYQHAAIFKYQHALRRNLSPLFNPDYIFTTGRISKKNLEKYSLIPKEAIINIGSIKNINIKNYDSSNNVCLVTPEGFFEECEIIFKFSLKCAVLNPDIKFIWRFHPLISFDLIKSRIPEFNNLPQNIMISKNPLKQDLSISRAILYRGSTVSISAGSNGIIPIYIKEKKEMTIDPIYGANLGKFVISSPKKFKEIFFSSSNKKHIINYCSKYYEPINYKKVSDFFYNLKKDN